jgi:peroxiredoxin family protein
MTTEAERDELIRQLTARVEALEAQAPGDALTLGVINGSLDHTMAALIVAIGAAVYDMQVDIFFTFWGTAALRDPKKTAKKGFMDKMFGVMLPRGAAKLPLSHLQMLGMGPVVIKQVMEKHGAKPLEELMKDAAEMGVRVHVCTMSMDLMGIKKEELIDFPGIDYIGVGTFVDMFSHAKQCWFF